jgi:hypothetical protein
MAQGRYERLRCQEADRKKKKTGQSPLKKNGAKQTRSPTKLISVGVDETPAGNITIHMMHDDVLEVKEAHSLAST